MMKRTKKALIVALSSIMVLGSATAFTSCEAVEGILGDIPFVGDLLSGLFGTEATLENIKVTTNPTKMDYLAGEEFDPAGMVITASYSDGSEKVVTDWTYSPTGALEAGKKVTVSYTEGDVTKTVNVSVNVTNDVVGLTIKTAPTKTQYLAGETFDPAGMVLEAEYENGDKKDIVVSESNATYNTDPLTAADTVITITYGGFEVQQEITFAKGVFIEAENGTIVSSTVVISDDSIVGGVNTASGGKYIGNMRANDSVTFSFTSDKAGVGDIEFRLASQYLKEDVNWDPVWMGDCQFNKICEFYVNGVKYDISDDAVLPGGGESGGTATDDLWFNWKEVKFTDISFVEGKNDITLKFIPHSYTDTSQESFSGSFTANIDSLIVTSADCEIAPFKALELTGATLGTDIKLEERDGKAYFVVAGGTYEYEANQTAEKDVAETLMSKLKSYFYFDVQNNPNEGGLEGWDTPLTNVHTITLGENNTFELAVDLSSLANNALTMHLAPEALRTSTAGWNDFKPDVEAFTSELNVNGRKYEILYDKTAFWGCLGIRISGEEDVTNDMTALAIKTAPTKTVYYVGETFDPAGMVLTATYENGDTEELTVTEIDAQYKTDPLTADDTVITITYNGFTVDQEITFNTETTEVVLLRIEVTTDPTKVDYVAGEEFDPAGMVVTAFYSNETNQVVTGWTYSPDGALEVGDKVQVSYTEDEVIKTAVVDINVTNNMTGLTIANAPTKTEYYVGETFDPAGMVLTATYENGDTEELTVTEIEAEYNTDPLTAEDTVITITYNGFTVDQTITFAKGVFIEAEDGAVVASNPSFPNDSADASGGLYVGNLRANESITFYFNSDKAGTGDIQFRLASQYLKEDNNWSPILMGDCQLNKICEIYVNEVKYDIPDSVILPGSGESGGTPDRALWCVWKDVELTNFSFVEGKNTIQLKFIEHDYDCSQDSFDNVFAANTDCLIITSKDCAISPCELYMSEDYKLTGVDMVVEDDVLYLVYTGTDLSYSGYEESEIAAAIKLNLQFNGGNWPVFFDNGAGRTITVDDDGNFTLKLDISSLNSEGTYMAHFGLPLNSNNLPADAKVANGVTVATNEDGTNKTFAIGKLVYELVPSDPNSWDLIVVKVSPSSDYKLTETAKLVVEDGQAYLVIENTWEGYTKDEALAKCSGFKDFQELFVFADYYCQDDTNEVVSENSRELYINLSDLAVKNATYMSHLTTGDMRTTISEDPDDLTSVTVNGKTYTLSYAVETASDRSWATGLTILTVTDAE